MKNLLLVFVISLLFSVTGFAQNDQAASRLQQSVESGLTLQTEGKSSLFSPSVLEIGKPFQQKFSSEIKRIVRLEEELFSPVYKMGEYKLQVLPNPDWDTSIQFSFRVFSSKKKKKK